MAHSSVIGAAIEGEKLQLQTRKLQAYPPKKDKQLGRMYFGFSLGIRGDAEISQAYEEPYIACVYPTSMYSVGDQIAGQSISGWSRKPFGDPHISKGSAAHSASFVSIAGGCYARVDISPRELLQNAQFQANNPPIIQVRRAISGH